MTLTCCLEVLNLSLYGPLAIEIETVSGGISPITTCFNWKHTPLWPTCVGRLSYLSLLVRFFVILVVAQNLVVIDQILHSMCLIFRKRVMLAALILLTRYEYDRF